MTRTRLICALAAGATVLALAGCAADGGAASATKVGADGATAIKVAVLPGNPTNAAVQLGVKQGIFKKEGLDVTFVNADANVTVSTLTTGGADFGWTSINAIYLARANNIDVKGVVTYTQSGADASAFPYQIVVKDGSPIKSAKDLDGKTVAVDLLGQWPQMLVQAVLGDHGADTSKIKYTEVSRPNMLDALEKGQVDAAAIPEPFLTTALHKGTHVLYSPVSDQKLTNLPLTAFLATDNFIKQNPRVVKEFATAVIASNKYALAHEDQVRDIIPSTTSYSADQAKTIRLYAWYDGPGDAQGYQEWATLLKDQGYLHSAIALNDVRYEAQ